ncbi:uncharacterized protein LOC129599412 [Paramacrobiotus metropolitanus]|uniref:uncharacterized protein LOC129599412 n=1 Tax=Paramacrobiotus metropolitanus TaxID=2943436 RepID=UPI002445EE60|nr:uncharacterized protein LOC129599412 [Paramacrobiotus metropolitanus]
MSASTPLSPATSPQKTGWPNGPRSVAFYESLRALFVRKDDTTNRSTRKRNNISGRSLDGHANGPDPSRGNVECSEVAVTKLIEMDTQGAHIADVECQTVPALQVNNASSANDSNSEEGSVPSRELVLEYKHRFIGYGYPGTRQTARKKKVKTPRHRA